MIALLLTASLSAMGTAKFDLLCKGSNTLIGLGEPQHMSYAERFSIDLRAHLFSNSDHVTPQKIVRLDDGSIWLQQSPGSYLVVDRFNSAVAGETDYGGGRKMVLSADCRVGPFTRWDHRAF